MQKDSNWLGSGRAEWEPSSFSARSSMWARAGWGWGFRGGSARRANTPLRVSRDRLFKSRAFDFSILNANASPTDLLPYPSQIKGLTGCLISLCLLDTSAVSTGLILCTGSFSFTMQAGEAHPYAKTRAKLSTVRNEGEGLCEPAETTGDLGVLWDLPESSPMITSSESKKH